jgi:hypothetical protein
VPTEGLPKIEKLRVEFRVGKQSEQPQNDSTKE